ncbi:MULTISPECIES: metallophosphoesterase family protein [Thiorhodovibrio]|uniref:metallophosphoesterase family protein n=1 Tax=Thiorhodovibrio TaxID=61593 RepID=UPI001912B242|nr:MULTISPECIES: DNA repair exonuclease [Thiorhodovibrio]MBK5970965.1 DNA repair exonuclease [Thiorhodovibrio winogradskyi]WPL10668.1 putative metallophosphoesterase YhaO [Thiorhodovibrio litoralis]
MPAFLHAADLHLDSPLTGLEAYEGAPVEEIRTATRRALENLVALAIAESVDALLLAGDIYDGDWRDYNTGLFFAAQMARLKEAGIPVMMVRGNHDAASQISRHLRLPDNVHEFPSAAPETIRLEQAGLAIHGHSYGTRQVEQNLARAYPPADPHGFNIGLLHTALDGREGHASYAPCHLDDLVRLGYDYWALGHVHRREVVTEQPWIIFPGNLQGRHARETGAKGATLVRIQDGRIESAEHHALDVVRWQQLELVVAENPSRNQIDERIARALQNAFDAADGRLLALRLRLCGQTEQDAQLRAGAEQLLNQCRVLGFEIAGRGIWIEKLVLDTKRPERRKGADQPSADAPSLGPLLETLADPASFVLSPDISDPKLPDPSLPDTELAAPDLPDPEHPPLAEELLQDVEELARKLPASLRHGEDALDLSAASLNRADGDLQQCLRDAHALLLAHLRGDLTQGHQTQ